MTVQEIKANIQKIQTLVAKGKTVDAINALIEFAPKLDNDNYQQTTISISANKKGIIKDEVQNLADSNDLAIRKSQVNNQILTLLTQIKNERIEGKVLPEPLPKPQSTPINLKILLPIAAIGIALLVYFVGFRTSTPVESEENSACDLSFEKASLLFENDIFEKAKLELTDIKYAKDCNYLYEEVDKMLAICNQKIADKNEETDNSNTDNATPENTNTVREQMPSPRPPKDNPTIQKKTACELSIKKVRQLMKDKEFAKARAELVDIKYEEACGYLSADVDKMLTMCDDALDSKTFKIFKTRWQATPQRHKGACPVTVQFSGSIFTNQKSGALQYFIEFGNRNGTRAVTKKINESGIVSFSFPYTFEKSDVYADKMKAVVKVINPKTQSLFYTSEAIAFEIKCE